MNNRFFDEYPKLGSIFEEMRRERRDEILEHLRKNDEVYAELVRNRTEQSMAIRGMLGDSIRELERYMDIICEQEIYELDKVYEYAFIDAVSELRRLNILRQEK